MVSLAASDMATHIPFKSTDGYSCSCSRPSNAYKVATANVAGKE